MGNCTKHTIKPLMREEATNNVLDRFSEEPEDTASFANMNLPKIDIRPLLRKVKVKNSPQVGIISFRKG